MAGLKPFRKIPEDIVEWTKWMNAQDVVGSGDITPSTTTTTNTLSQWTIDDFSGDYSIGSDDAGKVLRSTGGSATNVTVNSGLLEAGDQIVIIQYGAGTVTMVAGSGVTLRTPATLVFSAQYGTVTLIMLSDTEGVVTGNLAP